MRDMNDRVADYRGLVESLAGKFVGRNGAEQSDLEQEGLIAVWMALEKGLRPSVQVIEGRMQDWCRLLGAQIGRGRNATYGELLPIELVGEATHDPIPLPGHDPLA